MPFLRKISYILIFLQLIAFVSCTGNDPVIPDVPGDTEGSGYMQLIISMAGTQALTRADDPLWGDDYDSEDGIENESVINSMELYVVTADNQIYPLDAVEIEKYSRTYRYKVKLDTDYLEKRANGNYYLSGRIVAVANMPGSGHPDPFNLEEFNISVIKQRDGVIPMWGVVTISNMRIYQGQTVEAKDPIFMLRSVPKISFRLHRDIENIYVIKSVTSAGNDFEHNSLCHPAGAYSVPLTTALGIESCFNLPEVSVKGELPDCYGNGTRNVWLYTSEYDCPVSEDGKTAAFEITLARRNDDGGIEPGSEITGTIYLCDYENGQPDFSKNFGRLVRNHDYRYIINLAELSFKISFREWIPGGKVHVELE